MSSPYKSTETDIKLSELVVTSTRIQKYLNTIQCELSMRGNWRKEFFTNFSCYCPVK